jgi:hypothetical protein
LYIEFLQFVTDSIALLHLELKRQWKVIAFLMFCVDRRVCIVSI